MVIWRDRDVGKEASGLLKVLDHVGVDRFSPVLEGRPAANQRDNQYEVQEVRKHLEPAAALRLQAPDPDQRNRHVNGYRRPPFVGTELPLIRVAHLSWRLPKPSRQCGDSHVLTDS